MDDYKIGKGVITLETNKSGSFVFSLYPDHFFYDRFVKLKTVITVYKSNKIVFRGRILNDVTDYWNNKVITCEGELSFLQDSIIRPFEFNGTPEDLFRKFVTEHNAQVDEFKRFKIGAVTIIDANNYIARSNSGYESALSNLNHQFVGGSLGGYFYITHGDDDRDPIPTINYLADFTKISTQTVEFGTNLKDYTKTAKADDIATAIIPLGHEIDDGNDETDDTDNPKLTIASVNDGKDYVYSEIGVAKRGWIFKVVEWDEVTDPANLKRKAEEYLENSINQNITIELTAIDLHLIDHAIESFRVNDYIRVISAPHNFDSTLLCNKQTMDLLKPENDSLVLGYTYTTFTEQNNKLSSSVSNVISIYSTVNKISDRLTNLNKTVNTTEQTATEALNNYQEVSEDLGQMSGDLEIVANVATENARNIATNAQNIATNAANITKNAENIALNAEKITALESAVKAIKEHLGISDDIPESES
jgi:phage minor structural protein